MSEREPLARLGNLSVAAFMADYWQKRPALLRGVFPPDFCPLTPEDLKRLSTREDADSRLIITDEWPPELHYGPFDAEDFGDLPDNEWTLLVQEVDRLSAAGSAIQDRFRFVPNWRLDDLMVSYATPGGGVGAHVDQYDVFLIQGQGKRRWEINTEPQPDPAWREDSDVAVMAEFEPDESWVLEPGDVLYLPPNIPHNGVAIEPSLTLSVGFRAPAAAELLEGVVGFLSEEGTGRDRYLDPAPGVVRQPGLISTEVLAELRGRIRKLVQDDRELDSWIGRQLTEPVRGHVGLSPKGPLPEGARLGPSSAAQIGYARHTDGVVLFASGEAYQLGSDALPHLEVLAGTEGLDPTSVSSQDLRILLDELYRAGVLKAL